MPPRSSAPCCCKGGAIRFERGRGFFCGGFFVGVPPLRPRSGISSLRTRSANASAFALGEGCPMPSALRCSLRRVRCRDAAPFLWFWRLCLRPLACQSPAKSQNLRFAPLPLVLAALSAPFGLPVTCQKPEPPPPSSPSGFQGSAIAYTARQSPLKSQNLHVASSPSGFGGSVCALRLASRLPKARTSASLHPPLAAVGSGSTGGAPFRFP